MDKGIVIHRLTLNMEDQRIQATITLAQHDTATHRLVVDLRHGSELVEFEEGTHACLAVQNPSAGVDVLHPTTVYSDNGVYPNCIVYDVLDSVTEKVGMHEARFKICSSVDGAFASMGSPGFAFVIKPDISSSSNFAKSDHYLAVLNARTAAEDARDEAAKLVETADLAMINKIELAEDYSLVVTLKNGTVFTTKSIRGATGLTGATGKGFEIAKTYASVDEMEAGFETDELEEGAFVLIATEEVDNAENARLYTKGESKYIYLCDLSGAQGIKGERGYTPQFEVIDGALYIKRTDESEWELLDAEIPSLLSAVTLEHLNNALEAERAKVKLFITPNAEDDPAVLFGGTWERIKDKFILAAGDAYEAGSEGGSADAVVVEHNHKIMATYSTYGTASAESTGVQGVNDYLASYSKTVSTGESGTGKNMPPYLAVYMWQRVPDGTEDSTETTKKTYLFQNQTFNEGDQIDGWYPDFGVKYYASITGVGGTVTISAVILSGGDCTYFPDGQYWDPYLIYEPGMGWVVGALAYQEISDYIDGDDTLGYMPVTVSVWTEGGNTDNPNDGRVYLFENQLIEGDWNTGLPEPTTGVTYYAIYDGEKTESAVMTDDGMDFLLPNGDQVLSVRFDPDEGYFWNDCLYGSATVSVWYYP